ncbi:MAG TPA: hypothetical protein VNC22_23320 [Sporichthya sp.]|jgi:hypothetical protein|nr:hypothetical protein [Sporichthya sp.]
MRGDLVRIEIDVLIPTGFGFDAEQLTHMLIGRCHILHVPVQGASSATIGIFIEEDNDCVEDQTV